jgi:hypothetical protein
MSYQSIGAFREPQRPYNMAQRPCPMAHRATYAFILGG